jgi:FkbM family methyltransferase
MKQECEPPPAGTVAASRNPQGNPSSKEIVQGHMHERDAKANLAIRCVEELGLRFRALRMGIFFLRARWFKMPHAVRAAGKKVALHYPLEDGVVFDFIGCCVRNDYGLRQQLKYVKTILDIGANVGFFSVAARAHYPHARIHAYEPNRRSFAFLKSNTEQLGIEIYQEAVGADEGRVAIADEGDSNQAKTIASADGGIPQIALERAVERLGGAVDLLKLDCEGAEWDMFRSAIPWRHIHNIRMEYHLFDHHTLQDVEQTLKQLGFRITRFEPSTGFGLIWAVPFQS